MEGKFPPQHLHLFSKQKANGIYRQGKSKLDTVYDMSNVLMFKKEIMRNKDKVSILGRKRKAGSKGNSLKG